MHQARTRTPELVPIRYGRMLRSPFAFFRGAAAIMAADLADDAGQRPARAAVRRCAPRQLRRVRRAGSAAGLRPQRLRRDPARALGMGRQAPGREHRGRRPRSRVRRRARRDAVRGAARAYRKAMRASPRCARSTSGTPASTKSACRSTSPDPQPRDSSKAAAKARRKDSLRALAKLTYDVEASPGSSATRRWSCRSPSSAAPRTPSWSASACAATARLPEDPAAQPPPPARELPPRRRRAQGRRRGQRRHALLDRAAARQRRLRPAVPAGQGGRAVGARAVRRRASAGDRTRASASSRASS